MQFYGADTRAKGTETEEGKSNQGPDTGIHSFVTGCSVLHDHHLKDHRHDFLFRQISKFGEGLTQS